MASKPDGSNGWPMQQAQDQQQHSHHNTVAGTTYYRVLVNAANNGCEQAGNNAIAVISEDLSVTTQPTNINECRWNGSNDSNLTSGSAQLPISGNKS
jgi:hypothetical protein